MSDQSPLTKYARLWIALSANLFLVLLAWYLPHDGEDRGPALLSIAGHQHFILLHFPVAILMLIPFFEIWDRHHEASLIIRRLSLLGAVSIWATCVFGILEAYFNGSEYAGLGTHLWTGIAASFVASAAWLLIFQSWRVRVIAQIVAVVAMTVAAHIGGDKVHGDIFKPNAEATKAAYETAAPSGFLVPSAFAADQPANATDRDYAEIVAPLLAEHCAKCHGEKKVKGKLRVDTLAALKKGGNDGAAVVFGDLAKSHLYKRITLDPKDEEYMPPKAEEPLTESQRRVIQLWIEQKPIPAALALAAAAKPKAKAGAAQPRAEFAPNAATAPTVETIADQLGIAITPVAQDQAHGWRVAAHTAGNKFKSAQLGDLAPIAAQVAELDLAHAGLDDSSAKPLARFRNLRILSLADTRAGDGTAAVIADELNFLERVSFAGTALTDKGLLALANLPELQALYVGGTQVTPQGLADFRQRNPRCRVVHEIALVAKVPSPGIEPPAKEKALETAPKAKK